MISSWPSEWSWVCVFIDRETEKLRWYRKNDENESIKRMKVVLYQ